MNEPISSLCSKRRAGEPPPPHWRLTMFSTLGRKAILVIGRAGLDLYADPPGSAVEEATRFTSALGGSGANIATGIAKLGGATALLSAVSDDAVGRFVLRELDRYGVDRSRVRSLKGERRTSLAVVETRLENCQSVIYRNGAADFGLTEEDVTRAGIEDFGMLILTGTALAIEPSRFAALLAMRKARTAGVPVTFDVDYRPYSWASAAEAAATCRKAADLSDMIVGNDVEFDVMAGGTAGLALAQDLASSSTAVIYKMGEKGSVTFTRGDGFETPIDPVNALKPTGAGDAFMAGLVTGLAEGLALRDAVRRGTAAAAITVTRVGCAPASPTAEELAAFIRLYPRPA
jgi:5-dehydro-2-deoxygluconokinase